MPWKPGSTGRRAPPGGGAPSPTAPTSTPSARSPASPWNSSTSSISSGTPTGYRYTRFCDLYRRWLARHRLTMRQEHRAGEKVFVDYAGQKPAPGRSHAPARCIEVELFVGVLGASNYTYAEATRTQQLPDWLGSHQRLLRFFGGVPGAIVPRPVEDRGHRRLPVRAGAATHLRGVRPAHTAPSILPARPGKPRDKAKIEVARASGRALDPRPAPARDVLLAGRPERPDRGAARRPERPPDAPLRGEPPGALRAPRPAGAPAPARDALRLRRVEASPRSTSTTMSRSTTTTTRSPMPWCRPAVDVRLTALTVEIFQRGQRVAAHLRSARPGAHTTVTAHMPKAHQRHREWSPARLIAWAATVGPQTAAFVEAHPGRPAPPGAGLPLLPRDPAAGQAGRGGAARGRLRPGARGRAPARTGTSMRS